MKTERGPAFVSSPEGEETIWIKGPLKRAQRAPREEKNMKKALAMLLTLAMALSMLPMAFADVAEAPLDEAPVTVDEPAPADTAPVPTEEAPLADVDEAIQTAGEITAPVNAGTLQSQIDAASGETTVALTEDVTEDITIPAGKTIILDLAGHKLTNGTGDTITNNGTLTIKAAEAVGVGTREYELVNVD